MCTFFFFKENPSWYSGHYNFWKGINEWLPLIVPITEVQEPKASADWIRLVHFVWILFVLFLFWIWLYKLGWFGLEIFGVSFVISFQRVQVNFLVPLYSGRSFCEYWVQTKKILLSRACYTLSNHHVHQVRACLEVDTPRRKNQTWNRVYLLFDFQVHFPFLLMANGLIHARLIKLFVIASLVGWDNRGRRSQLPQ